MNKQKFQKLYRPEEWEKLVQDNNFMRTYELEDYETATAIAAEVLHGKAQNKSEHKKLKFERYIREEYR